MQRPIEMLSAFHYLPLPVCHQNGRASKVACSLWRKLHCPFCLSIHEVLTLLFVLALLRSLSYLLPLGWSLHDLLFSV